MSYRENCKESVRRFITGRFWEDEYKDLFSDDLYIEFHSAPPGMLQWFDDYRQKLTASWLHDTVKRWDVDLEHLYSVPADPNTYFVIGFFDGDVRWGGRDGKFHSKFIMKINMYNGKIVRVKMMLDPMEFLRAAGREVPRFEMNLDNSKIDDFIKNMNENPMPPMPPLDLSPAAIRKRIQGNLDLYKSNEIYSGFSELGSFADDMHAEVWFLPPGMEKHDGVDPLRIFAWSELSCPNVRFWENGMSYPTDDPLVYICECRQNCNAAWVGHDEADRYFNEYFDIIHLNDAGQICCLEEYLNTINKFNSINVSVPSFPFLYSK